MEQTARATSHDSTTGAAPAPSEIRPRGGWLILARLVGAGIVVFAFSVFVADGLPALSLLRVVCAAHCLSGQLTPSQAHALGRLGISPDVYAAYAIALTLLTSLVWFGAAALIFWRRSNTLFLLLVGAQLVTQGALGTPSGSVATASGPVSWVVATAALTTLNDALLCVVLALFPTGRFAPRWMGWLLMPAVAALLLARLLPAGADIQDSVLAVCLAGLILAQIYRYRAVSTPLQRQQTRWVIVGMVAVMLVQVAIRIPPLLDSSLATPGSLYPILFGGLRTVALTLVPVALTVAMLRYRLYDLGLLLNRTLVYGSLTILLAAVYAGCVVVLQAVVRGVTGQQNSTVATVVSTLAIAALFQPLRRRIQAFIDRRFYRRKYDAAEMLAAFSAVLRNEVDLDNLCRELVEVVDEAMQPAHAWLWLRPTPAGATPPQAHSNR